MSEEDPELIERWQKTAKDALMLKEFFLMNRMNSERSLNALVTVLLSWLDLQKVPEHKIERFAVELARVTESFGVVRKKNQVDGHYKMVEVEE